MSNEPGSLIFIISAPSGTGKTTLIHRVMALDQNLAFSVSHTTRAPREGEIDGRDYYFVNHDEFQKLVSEGVFIEWAEVYGEFYGTSRREIKRLHGLWKDVVLDIDVQGAMQVMSKLDRQKWVSIFILPPNMGALRQRLISREKDSLEHLEKRLLAAKKEIENASKYDYQIVNDDLQRATRELLSIIQKARKMAS